MPPEPPWQLILPRGAQKQLARVGPPDRNRLLAALEEMRQNPLAGDVARLKHQPTALRRRVGSWRIFFDVNQELARVEVAAIERRTSTTYRRR